MHRTALAVILMGTLITITGCATTTGHPRTVAAATPAQKAALLDRVKSLAGTWETADEHGQMKTASVFAVTSNGSAVREVMFPGSEHEMTNMYTMDGPDLVLTHYCAIGNQPRMRARADGAAAGGTGDHTIAFRPDGVSNMTSSDQMYMGEMTMVFKDADHVRMEWRSFQNGKLADHSPGFELVRKK